MCTWTTIIKSSQAVLLGIVGLTFSVRRCREAYVALYSMQGPSARLVELLLAPRRAWHMQHHSISSRSGRHLPLGRLLEGLRAHAVRCQLSRRLSEKVYRLAA